MKPFNSSFYQYSAQKTENEIESFKQNLFPEAHLCLSIYYISYSAEVILSKISIILPFFILSSF